VEVINSRDGNRLSRYSLKYKDRNVLMVLNKDGKITRSDLGLD